MKTAGNKKPLLPIFIPERCCGCSFKIDGHHNRIQLKYCEVPKFENHIVYKVKRPDHCRWQAEVKKSYLNKFGIKQPVFFAGLNWECTCTDASQQTRIK